MVDFFCDIIVAVSSVLSSSRVATTAVLNRFCGYEMLVLVLVGLVLTIAVADIVG